MITKDDLIKILIRAVYTFAEVALSYITIGMAISDVDWKHMLSVAAVAMVYSVLKSFIVGIPENKTDGTLTISMGEEGTPQWLFNATSPLEDISRSSVIRMKIDNKMEE